MKKLLVPIFAAIALAPLFALAASGSGDHAGHGAMPMDAREAALADGVVKKIDKAGGKLTVSHDALPNGMPAMTMAFKVKDSSWLDQVKEGQKIRFATESKDGAIIIVRLEPQK